MLHVSAYRAVREWSPDQFVVKNCFVCRRVGSDEAVRVEFASHLNLLMPVPCFKLERAEDVIAVHTEGKIPQFHPSRNRLNVGRYTEDELSELYGEHWL